MNRYFYSDSIDTFLEKPEATILGILADNNSFALETTQRDSWKEEIRILKSALAPYRDQGTLYFEFSIPRLGRRIDVVALIGPVVFVIEFKIGEKRFESHAIDQVFDYSIDLKNFHESSHDCVIAPVLVATSAETPTPFITTTREQDLLVPILANKNTLGNVFDSVLAQYDKPVIIPREWEQGRYSPTPTIIEAATALYRGHSVAEISRHGAEGINLTLTSDSISEVITWAKANSRKAICFITGVPGAGKTLVGLNIATKHMNPNEDLHSVFLSGNGPLVAILREALARDRVQQELEQGRKLKKGTARSEVQTFVQNVHHFRDECLVDAGPPKEHVAIFDEAQRAWNLDQTSSFMRRKKGKADFCQSEPEFLISCLDRHRDWAVIVCLVGGGQEINTGEAGISEWIDSLIRGFPSWQILISPQLTDSEYTAGGALERLRTRTCVELKSKFHLSVSMRSFRANQVSSLIKQVLDLKTSEARQLTQQVKARFPIVITRDLDKAKRWVKAHALGSERYGIVVSSQALRLKPHAIDVKSPMDPIHWFLDGKNDVRSSFYLEDVATEFHIQGLELDWVCVTWDADFRHTEVGWEHWSFVGHRWQRINKLERQMYLKNAYRVLLTRARQGMVIVIPEGDPNDPTRKAGYYDSTFDYLREIGFDQI